MSGRDEILFLSHRIPYPPDKGDKIRSWRLLQFLSERYRVHLACFVDDPADFAHEKRLSELCESATLVALDRKIATMRSARGLLNGAPLTCAYFRDQRMANAVEKLRERPLVAEVAFSSTMAQYIEREVSGRPRLIDFCDADSQKFSDYADDASFPMAYILAREARTLGAYESVVANWADASFAITPEEAALFNRRGLSRRVGWWRNGVDTDYFDPTIEYPAFSGAADIVFTGAMDYRANIDAADWFVREVWPTVHTANPRARLAIVGARPTGAVKALERVDGVCVTGRVEDIRPWIAQAKMAVAPLRVARGVQNKVLEAMAMAKPVVATSAAATGISLSLGEEVVIADSSADFADKVNMLLHDNIWRREIGAAARARALTDYQWARQLARFGDALQSSIGSSSSSKPPAMSAA